MTTVSLLAPHLTWNNHRRLIREASGKSVREVEALIASFSAAPPIAERVRFIGAAPVITAVSPAPDAPDLFIISAASSAVPPASSTTAISAPPADGQPKTLRVQFSFTANEIFFREVERAKELLRHQSPAGRLEDVFEAAVTALLDKIDPERRIRRGRARVSPYRRRISPAQRDAVWRRDGGRCVYRSSDGRVCGARAGLQIDHILPWARGGASDPKNLRLLCRAHNLLEARRVFGSSAIDAAVARRIS
ncbi:MAG: HNH endonuclease [Elusimicrobiota bacterium]